MCQEPGSLERWTRVSVQDVGKGVSVLMLVSRRLETALQETQEIMSSIQLRRCDPCRFKPCPARVLAKILCIIANFA